MTKTLCFDMDGTIADLYGVNNWLDMLRAEDATPYKIANPLWDMSTLNEILRKLQQQGWQIRVVTWLSKDSSPSYNKSTRIAKRGWLLNNDFPFDSFHGVKYGTNKRKVINDLARRMGEVFYPAILVDDDESVRQSWGEDTINPANGDLIERLEALLV